MAKESEVSNPHKPPSKKIMNHKPITFKTICGNHLKTEVRTEECAGFHAFDLFGYTWVAHSVIDFDSEDFEVECWRISEVSTGRNIPMNEWPSMELAIERGREYLEMLGERTVKEGVEKARQQNEELLKVNP
jgi:hypothetical protein